MKIFVTILTSIIALSCNRPDISSSIVSVAFLAKKPGNLANSTDQFVTPICGSAFLAKYNGHLFLVTNYHLMANRYSIDTTQYDRGYGDTTDMVLVGLLTAQDETVNKQVLSMYNGKRLYFSFPASPIDRSVIDIAILPISHLPPQAVNMPVNFDAIDTSWSIAPGSELLLCGFKNNVYASLIDPIKDIVISASDRSFSYKDRWIYARYTFPIQGDSGSPVYCIIKGKSVLVGIVSISCTNSDSATYQAAKNAGSLKSFHAFEGLKTIVDGLRAADQKFYPKED